MSRQLFETTRLVVREFCSDDLDAFAALCADPQAMRFMGDGTTLPRAEVARWIDVCQQRYADPGYGTSAVFEKNSGAFVGFCGVIRAAGNDFSEIIYAYRSEAWGRGYATEAGRAMITYVFERSALDQIFATIDHANADSIRVVEKLGMRYEKQVCDDGALVDFYRIDRADWATT
jgi:[ribosomal protein S5]-alanine N-acetyltransferase